MAPAPVAAAPVSTARRVSSVMIDLPVFDALRASTFNRPYHYAMDQPTHRSRPMQQATPGLPHPNPSRIYPTWVTLKVPNSGKQARDRWRPGMTTSMESLLYLDTGMT